jgi:hypothetical protein
VEKNKNFNKLEKFLKERKKYCHRGVNYQEEDFMAIIKFKNGFWRKVNDKKLIQVLL